MLDLKKTFDGLLIPIKKTDFRFKEKSLKKKKRISVSSIVR